MSLDGISLKCTNFKCFADEPQGFDEIKPINVIIGRNNSGKTTLLDLVEFATNLTDINRLGHKQGTPEVILSWPLTEEQITKDITDTQIPIQEGNLQWGFPAQRWALHNLVGKRFHCRLTNQNTLTDEGISDFDASDTRQVRQVNWVTQKIRNQATNQFRDFECRRIVADRDVTPEQDNAELTVGQQGRGVTNLVQKYITSDALDRDVVEITLLNELNAIFRPDANYSRLLVGQRGDSGPWEIFLEEPRKGRIRLSQTGSGLKTVLLVLVNLLIVPLLHAPPHPLSKLFFAFEELENNLHPAIQRRLFRYLREKAVSENCHFFITTHSNVVIDLFSNDDQAQLLHVTHDGDSATVTRVETDAHGHHVLDDLDIRASDLLQTNAIVWVEGPSDCIYFNRWIELWTEGQLLEGIHFQCLPFGGAAGSHVSFEWPDLVENLIAAIKINRHAILVADSDQRQTTDEPKEYTQRMAKEIEQVGGYAWITAGKEVENYIPIESLRTYLSDTALKGPGQYTDVLQYIATKKGNKTPPRKVDLAHSIVPLLDVESLKQTYDIAVKLDSVCELIRKWNRLDD